MVRRLLSEQAFSLSIIANFDIFLGFRPRRGRLRASRFARPPRRTIRVYQAELTGYDLGQRPRGATLRGRSATRAGSRFRPEGNPVHPWEALAIARRAGSIYRTGYWASCSMWKTTSGYRELGPADGTPVKGKPSASARRSASAPKVRAGEVGSAMPHIWIATGPFDFAVRDQLRADMKLDFAYDEVARDGRRQPIRRSRARFWADEGLERDSR